MYWKKTMPRRAGNLTRTWLDSQLKWKVGGHAVKAKVENRDGVLSVSYFKVSDSSPVTIDTNIYETTLTDNPLAPIGITSNAGLSLALGAFIAGLIISESEYSHQALGNILPFRNVFTSFFFVSIGMLLDTGFLINNPVIILIVSAGVLILKALIACSAAILLGLPLRSGIIAGLSICQVGEFSFILSRTGLEHGLFADHYQLFLAVAVLTMAATPFIISFAPRFADLVLRIPIPTMLKVGFLPELEKKSHKKLKQHLVIIGFGLNGRNVARFYPTMHVALWEASNRLLVMTP